MRDINRIEPILELVRELWTACPDLRLGQLIQNAAVISGWKTNDVFYIEDDQLANGIKKLVIGSSSGK